MKRCIFLFPGQGAQYVGMGKDFYDTYSAAKRVFNDAEAILGYSLSKIIFEGPAEKLMETKYSQVGIFVVSMALHAVLKEKCPFLIPSACAGLSLGEYSALCASCKIDFKSCLELVKLRGEAMQEACEKHPGSLRVVLGLDSEEVKEAVRGLQEVWIANLNCPNQVVIAGTYEGLNEAEPLLKAKGAKRVLPLDVSGAFHSGLMLEAQEKLKEKIQTTALQASPIGLVMNVCGKKVDSTDEMRRYLIDQVVSPTLWEKSIRFLEEQGVDIYIEIGCGKTLGGMNKKIGVGAATISLEKLEDLQKLEASFAEAAL